MTVNAAGIGALAKQFDMHVAGAQDVWQSGTDCFSWGQQFMSSPTEAMPAIAAIEPASAIAAADVVTTGAIESPTIARTESRRKTNNQSFTRSAFHKTLRMKAHFKDARFAPHEKGYSRICVPAAIRQKKA
jgi:hypothetical protein